MNTNVNNEELFDEVKVILNNLDIIILPDMRTPIDTINGEIILARSIKQSGSTISKEQLETYISDNNIKAVALYQVESFKSPVNESNNIVIRAYFKEGDI